MSINHGGAINKASQRYGIAVDNWLDLSTGISPVSWPVPTIPQQVWQRLPENDDGLTTVAGHYYGCCSQYILPIPGSQYAIERVPTLFAAGVVALPFWGYAEHAYHWQQAGHLLVWYNSFEQLQQLINTQPLTAVVVINPNNPSGELFTAAQLLLVRDQLAARQHTFASRSIKKNTVKNDAFTQATLIVDEAFMDSHGAIATSGNESLCPQFSEPKRGEAEGSQGLIVLRSLGKFFGLAGLRLGFVMAQPAQLAVLAKHLSPWAVNHPARWLGQQALADTHWQLTQHHYLVSLSSKWLQRLSTSIPQLRWQGSCLFITGFACHAVCQQLYDFFARKGVLLRLLEPTANQLDNGLLAQTSAPAAIRIGLPTAEQEQQLTTIIQQYTLAV